MTATTLTPWDCNRSAAAAASVAVTADVAESGPARVNGSELRNVTNRPPIAAERNKTVMPNVSHGDNGPEKINAA